MESITAQYKSARRAYRALCKRHLREIVAADIRRAAYTGGRNEVCERLRLNVAASFGVNESLLDDVIEFSDYEEFEFITRRLVL